MENLFQRTINRKVVFEGVGLHSGLYESVALLPAPVHTGIVFVKKKGDTYVRYPLTQSRYLDCSLCTSLDICGESIYTVEHLFSVLFVLKITNLFVFMEGHEIPILDGSSLSFWEKIAKVGVCEQKEDRGFVALPKDPFSICLGNGSSCSYQPSDQLIIQVSIQFDHCFIGSQFFDFVLSEEDYYRDICSARTFGDMKQVDQARSQGLLKGASLSCGLLYGEKQLINAPLRFKEEPVRHKILDFLGDMFLFSCDLKGEISMVRPSHALNSLFVKKLKEECLRLSRL